ncbi:MAG: hypothetical protein LBL85_05405 [Methanocalculaceae archaeon]|jgi:hypothetical protein|nr:hypothetical protein [Methanocalculaceae archaeon]
MKHLKKILITAILLLAFVGPANAAVTDQQVSFEILTEDQIKGPERAPPMNDVIRQGETDYYSYTPVSGSKLEISFTWDGASSGNDLDLYIRPPNNEPSWIQDDIDGRFDGKISLRTSLTADDLNHLWKFDVTGAQVSGTQSYTLTINSY